MVEFEEVWFRVKKETGIKTMGALAELLEMSQQNISRQKKDGTFPPGWAYLVAKKYGLSTEWIMTGEGPKRLGDPCPEQKLEAGRPGPDQQAAASPKGIIEEWVEDVRKEEGGDGRIVAELMVDSEEFRDWFIEKKKKAYYDPEEVPEKKAKVA